MAVPAPATHGAQCGVAVGDLVSAPPHRRLRAALAQGAGRDHPRALDPGPRLRRRGSRARCAAGVPRPGRARQRLRHRPHQTRAASALAPGADDAQDRPDVTASPDARAVLRRTRALAERRGALRMARALGAVGLTLTLAMLATAPEPVKVVYHVNEGRGQATGAMRDLPNHPSG